METPQEQCFPAETAGGSVAEDDEQLCQPGDPEEIRGLLVAVRYIRKPGTRATQRRQVLERLSMALRPQQLRVEARRIFIQRAIGLGIAELAVSLIESGSELALPASNLLVDFTFGSDLGAHVVLKVFDRITACFKKHVFETLNWDDLPLLESAVLLCTNIAAVCPSGHQLLIPLVQPVCLRIIKSSRASEELRGNSITLLANLSMTVASELRSLRVADVLLGLVLDGNVGEAGRSVAESVIIYLHGEQQSEEVDKLMAADVVGKYCVPLMECTLKGDEFRGMYPYLMYSARVFQVLSQSRIYAEFLAADERVVPLLLEATHCHDGPVRMESDLEGRRLALEALSALAGFGLWPKNGAHDKLSAAFVAEQLPLLLCDEHAGTRAAAVELWARFNGPVVLAVLLLGQRLADARFPKGCWRFHVLPFIFPFLVSS